ncbi:MAG: sirohydrochlorin cobaltochelatase [Clostridia bacterium]|nr:sirohydrochlorin cobaltochelatase [Clostridia bacterium]
MKAILAASYGSGSAAALEKSVVPLENAFAEAYPGYTVRRAFTGQRIRARMNVSGIPADSPAEALERLAAEGFDEVVVQPSHVTAGTEYERLCAEAAAFEGRFAKLRIGVPLLYDRTDIAEVCRFLYGKFRREGWLTVLVGHGSEHGSEWIYDGFREVCREAGYRDLFAAALEGSPDLDDLLPVLRASGCRNIMLVPLLFTAGVHAVRDIAGDAPESRKSRLEAEGFAVDAVMRGLGEYEDIRNLYVSHIAAALAE